MQSFVIVGGSVTNAPRTQTDAAAADVLARAARDGERVVCIARTALAILTVIAWPIWAWDGLKDGVAADWAVIVLSFGSLLFSAWVLWWLRGERPQRNTPLLRTMSISVDAVLIVGGLFTFVDSMPDGYKGILREPGVAFTYVGVVAGGIRLRYPGAIYAALIFALGLLTLILVDARLHPEFYGEGAAPAVLTAAGLWLTASVFSMLIARRTGEHVKEGAKNAADEIEKLHADKVERTQQEAHDLETTVGVLLSILGNDADGHMRAETWLDRRYRVDEPIGKGGMGRVYRGWDDTEKKSVAIKVIRAQFGTDPHGLIQRFMREVVAASGISHDAVVRMETIRPSKNKRCIFQVQEYVDGVTLEHYLDACGPLSPSLTAELGRHLCSALLAAHSRGVIHRDIKPSNVMLTKSKPGVKLIDFGIAKITEARAETETGQVIGTRRWMSPEQKAGEVVDSATDIYSLGLVLASAVTGKMPEQDGFEDAVQRIPVLELRLVIQYCLREKPDERLRALHVMTRLEALAKELQAKGLETLQHPAGKASSSDPGTISRLDEIVQRIAEAAPKLDGDAPDLGSYRQVEALLGNSAHKGQVWLARESEGDGPEVRVAVRRLSRAVMNQLRDRLDAAEAIYHPNICPVREVEGAGDDGYVVTPFIEGPTLRESFAQFSGPELRRIASEIGAAILCIQRHGCVHGSVRAENVRMMGTTPILLDFGAPGSSDDYGGFITLLQEIGLMSASRPPAEKIEEVVKQLQPPLPQ